MKSFCINLDRRPERWAVTKQHLDEVGITGVTRFNGIDDSWRGCRDSHLKIMEENIKEDLLIMEDDAEFVVKPWDLFYPFLELPNTWDVLYLGCSPQEPQVRYSDHLFKINNALCLHAYIINNRHGCIDYILSHRNEIKKIDDFFVNRVQMFFDCYCTFPLACVQRETGTSDTCGRSDVSTILSNFSKYCK